MIETNAIFIDGIPGSGKTTQSEWLNNVLIGAGEKTMLFLEMGENHPLRVYEPTFTDFSQPSQSKAAAFMAKRQLTRMLLRTIH